MLRVTMAGLRYRKARLMLSALAIVLGVAFVAGTLMMTASINRSYFGSFSAGAQNVSVAVAAPESGDPPGQIGGPALPATALTAVRSVPGVASAAGRLGGSASLLGGNGKLVGTGFGINVSALNPFTLVSGHLPSAPDQVDIDKSTAVDEHFRLGQSIHVVSSAAAISTFYLAGTIDLGVSSQFGNASVTAFQTAAAVAVTGQHGYNLIVASAAPGVSQSVLAARIAARLKGDEVITGAQLATDEANSTAHGGKVLTTGLLIFALISLVVACIVVYNTFNILIAQRSRELALQRCVGASRGQVFGAMLTESFVTGLAAAVTGVLAGIAVSWGLLRLISTHPPLVISPAPAGIALGTGVLVTVGASVLPARAATRVAPLTALATAIEPAVTARVGWRRLAVAAVACAIGAGLTAAGLQAGSSSNVLLPMLGLAAGGCVCFVAVLALGPVIAPPVIAFLGWLPSRLTRVTARLATANARRNPHRVATTTAALTIGITLMTLFSIVVSSAQKSTDAAIDGHYPFDYLVQNTGNDQPVPPRITAVLGGSPELALVASVYQHLATVDRQPVQLAAYSHDALGTAVRPAMVSGSLTAVGPGTAAVDITADVGLGSTITLSTPDAGTERLRVVAVYNSQAYKSPLPVVLISTADYLRGYRPAGPDSVMVDAAPGVSTAVSRAVVTNAIASDPLLEVDTAADYKAQLNARIDTILEMFAALLGLAILIALFGISSTLTLSVIERTRESSLLRALGLTRGQLRRMLLCEAGLMAALAAIIGLGLGSAFGLAMVHALGSSSNGRVQLSVPYGQLLLYALVSGVAALLAAVMPARRAARTAVVTDQLWSKRPVVPPLPTGRGTGLFPG
jgi:putative ABC transport system permease protein